MFNIFDNYKITYALIPFVMPKDACYQDCSAKKAFWYSLFMSVLITGVSTFFFIGFIKDGFDSRVWWLYCVAFVGIFYGIWVFFKLRKCLYENSLCPECNEAFCIHRTKEKVVTEHIKIERVGGKEREYRIGVKEVFFKCQHCGYEFNEDIEYKKPA